MTFRGIVKDAPKDTAIVTDKSETITKEAYYVIVDVPVLSPAGSGEADIKATINTLPGVNPVYKVGDAVLVDFETNDYSHATIIGKLYTDTETMSGDINVEKLKTKTIDVEEALTTNAASVQNLTVNGNLTLTGNAKQTIQNLINASTSSLSSSIKTLKSNVSDLSNRTADASTKIETMSAAVVASADSPETGGVAFTTDKFNATKIKMFTKRNLGDEMSNTEFKKFTYKTVSTDEEVDHINYAKCWSYACDKKNIGTFSGLDYHANIYKQEYILNLKKIFNNNEKQIDNVKAISLELVPYIPEDETTSVHNQKLHYIKIDNNNTFLKTDCYTICPGYYTQLTVYDEDSEKDVQTSTNFRAYIKSKPKSNTIRIDIGFSSHLEKILEIPDTLYITAEYAYGYADSKYY